MTRAYCLQPIGGLRQLSNGGQKVIKMQDIPKNNTDKAGALTSGSSGGKFVLAGHSPAPSGSSLPIVRKTVGVLGGDARIRDTRIAVWMLVRARQLGMNDEEICSGYRPPLDEADLDAAWQYYSTNREEIDHAIAENETD